MMRQKVIDTLTTTQEPLTMDELSSTLGIPRPLLHTALLSEFYNQVEFNHPKHGWVTAWATKQSSILVDGKGGYTVLTPEEPVEEPEPEPLAPELEGFYVDRQRPGLVFWVKKITPTWISGILLAAGGMEHPHSGRVYGADAVTFRAVWEKPEETA